MTPNKDRRRPVVFATCRASADRTPAAGLLPVKNRVRAVTQNRRHRDPRLVRPSVVGETPIPGDSGTFLALANAPVPGRALLIKGHKKS